MVHNEDSRVKIPSLIHLTRLGWTYLSLKGLQWDAATNIFPHLLSGKIREFNLRVSDLEVKKTLTELALLSKNEDLGKAFHERISDDSGIRLIDFKNFDNNSFHVVTELPCENGDESFRPDITLLVNGLPLVFIEVKKPNNRDGILAEQRRMLQRFRNPAFQSFFNLTQIMVFSNNMDYDDCSPEPLEGAFYATPSRDALNLNYFREENPAYKNPTLPPDDPALIDFILKDTNLVSIRDSPEFKTNLSPTTPTNRLSTSLFMRQRLEFFLRFGLTHVKTNGGLQKHIMRYPQFFASQAIREAMDSGIRKGIVWHTQGSGKTALAYYNVPFLTWYFSRQKIIPKFYFIVDRLDLLTQAGREFRSRGLVVHEIESRADFAKDIKSVSAIHNAAGQLEITVVNIQKFQDDPDVVSPSDYALNLQRIYFLDEVHRSYNPSGSFLANFKESDPQAILIGLTGTPLLGKKEEKPVSPDPEADSARKKFSSTDLFGGYLHKYYYNASISDGYTLRLIREAIQTEYKNDLKDLLKEIQLLKGSAKKKLIYADERFVEPMLDYIVTDFEKSRIALDDPTIGAMVICDSSEQAKMMAAIFEEKYSEKERQHIPRQEARIAAEQDGDGASNLIDFPTPYRTKRLRGNSPKTHALILHDVGTKQERKDFTEDFKEGKIDLLFVYNMLLTGFDAPRLKKLYLGRTIRDHNLLQALTRVNRTYQKHRYGYVVDFADISEEFEKTNQAYLRALEEDLGDEMEHYSDLFKTREEIQADIERIKDTLFRFDIGNAEIFSQQITRIEDRTEMREILRALGDARSLYNLIRLSGQYELLQSLDFKKLNQLHSEAQNHLTLLNQKDALENAHDTSGILNLALEDIIFAFRKISEEEMKIADELQNTLRKTREGLLGNFDPGDPEFMSLREELERLFKKKNLKEVTRAEMEANIAALNEIHRKNKELTRHNELLRAKYENDAKYARLHKRLLEKGEPTPNERTLCEALTSLKAETDLRVANDSRFITKAAFAEKELNRIVIEQLKTAHQLPLTLEGVKFISALVLQEYLNEFHGDIPA